MDEKRTLRKPARTIQYCDDAEFNAVIQRYLKDLELPEPRIPSKEELERRSQLLEQTRRIRDELGPMPFTVGQSVREDRERGIG